MNNMIYSAMSVALINTKPLILQENVLAWWGKRVYLAEEVSVKVYNFKAGSEGEMLSWRDKGSYCHALYRQTPFTTDNSTDFD